MGELELLVKAYKANSRCHEPVDYIKKVANRTLASMVQTDFDSHQVAKLIKTYADGSNAREGAAALDFAVSSTISQAHAARVTIGDAIALIDYYYDLSVFVTKTSATLSRATNDTLYAISQTQITVNDVRLLMRGLLGYIDKNASSASLAQATTRTMRGLHDMNFSVSDALSVIKELYYRSDPPEYSLNLAGATLDVLHVVREYSHEVASAVKLIWAYHSASNKEMSATKLAIATCNTLEYWDAKQESVDALLARIKKLPEKIKVEEASQALWGLRWLYHLRNHFELQNCGAIKLSNRLVSG